jgi:DNA-binding GntR family transcriptional regulator
VAGKLALQIPRPDETVPEQIVRLLTRAIIDGQLEPGRRLTEPELMEYTGVSRTSVREAMHHLQQIGLLEPAPPRGVRIVKLGRHGVLDVYEVRIALEPTATALFTERATDAEVEQLIACIEPIGVAGEVRLRSIYRYDELLVAGARNPVLGDFLTTLHTRIHALRRLSTTIPYREEESVTEYFRIAEAIRRRDPEAAAEACRDHVKAALSAALAALGESDE